MWIVSLDLSRAFDRAHWPALWTPLFEQGVPQHLIWILQRVHYGQHCEIVSDFGQNESTVILCCPGICYAKIGMLLDRLALHGALISLIYASRMTF